MVGQANEYWRLDRSNQHFLICSLLLASSTNNISMAVADYTSTYEHLQGSRTKAASSGGKISASTSIAWDHGDVFFLGLFIDKHASMPISHYSQSSTNLNRKLAHKPARFRNVLCVAPRYESIWRNGSSNRMPHELLGWEHKKWDPTQRDRLSQWREVWNVPSESDFPNPGQRIFSLLGANLFSKQPSVVIPGLSVAASLLYSGRRNFNQLMPALSPVLSREMLVSTLLSITLDYLIQEQTTKERRSHYVATFRPSQL